MTGIKQQFTSKTLLSSAPRKLFSLSGLLLCTCMHCTDCTAGTVHESSKNWFSFCCSNSGWLLHSWKRSFVFLCWAMHVYTTLLHRTEIFLTPLIVNHLQRGTRVQCFPQYMPTVFHDLSRRMPKCNFAAILKGFSRVVRFWKQTQLRQKQTSCWCTTRTEPPPVLWLKASRTEKQRQNHPPH